jgi:predicted O-methyltransferase YrrM
MHEIPEAECPASWRALCAATEELGFDLPSDARTGALLRTLAASKPGGRLLELGTGTGLATSWLLDGMDASAQLVTVDNDDRVQSIARNALAADARVEFVLDDGVRFLGRQPAMSFDMVFADAWPGKYEARDIALGLVKPGGFYVGDDMLPQANWPEGHQPRVDELIQEIPQRSGLGSGGTALGRRLRHRRAALLTLQCLLWVDCGHRVDVGT